MTGIVILAAGQSSRLGRPKQSLVFNGKTLLQWAVNAAIYSGCAPVVLVLGAYADVLLPDVEGHEVQIVHNPGWQEGMASSVRLGIAQLQKTEGITAAVILLCDQPFAGAALIKQLIAEQLTSRKGIVACAYNNTLGVPVLFQQSYFAELLSLTGQEGARKLLTRHPDDISRVPFEKGAVDIDTDEDYRGLVG